MPACPACGVAMTPDEWNTGSCFACHAPLLEQKRYYEPASAFDPTSPSSVKIRDDHRPAWGTVRTAFGLQIVGVVLLWCGAGKMSLLDLAEHPIRKMSPGMAVLSVSTIVTVSAAWFCLFAGYVMCAAVPSVERVRCWMWGSLSAAVLAAGLFAALHVMTGANRQELDQQARRARYLQALDVRAETSETSGDDSLWSPTTIRTTSIAVLSFAAVAFAAFVGFVRSLTGFLRRRRLGRVLLGLCAVLAATGAGLLALVSWETFSPEQLARGLPNATEQQAVNAFLFLSMAALTIYAGCCWKLRNDIGTLLRGEHLR